MSLIPESIKNRTFAENCLLILLTAVLTGFLVPYLNARIQDQNFREQRKFESDLARQAKIIDAQDQLLADFERVFPTFTHKALAVTWYKTHNDPIKYEQSRQSYEDAAWGFYRETEPLLSKASRLASDKSYQELRAIFRQIQLLDSELTELMQKESSSQEEWQTMHDKISFLPVGQATNALASEFGFSVVPSVTRTSAHQAQSQEANSPVELSASEDDSTNQ